jgi:hypothetical protein
MDKWALPPCPPLPIVEGPTTYRGSTPLILGDGLEDTYFSFHTYRVGGRSHVSRKIKGCIRAATAADTVEHGRWHATRSSEVVPTRYREWTIEDCIYITRLCM